MQKETRQFRTATSNLSFLGLFSIFVLLTSVAVGQHYAFITNQGDFGDEVQDDVSVIDLGTNTVVATIPAGHYPQGVAINPAGTVAYIGNTVDNSFTVIDIPEFTSVTIPGPGGVGASGAAIHPNGRLVYISNPDWMTGGETSTIWVVDRATNTIIDEIACGKGTCGIAVHPDGKVAYATNAFDGTMVVIDLDTHAVLDTIILETVGPDEPSMPVPLAIHPEGTYAYAANRQGPTFWAVNTTTHAVVARPFGSTHVCMGVHPNGSAVYLSDFGDADPNLPPQGTTVDVIDTETLELVTSIDGMDGPLGVTVHPDGTRLYVVNVGSDAVSVVDAVTYAHITDIAVGGSPEAYGQFIGPGVPRLLMVDAVARLEVVKGSIEGGAEGMVSPEYAIEHLASALESGHTCLQENMWLASNTGELDPRRLQTAQGDTVFQSGQAMVQAILDAVRRGWIMDAEIRSELLAVVDEVVRADRVLVAVAIDDAIVAGTDSDGISNVQEVLNQADALVKEARVWDPIEKKASLLDNAISQCQNAWQMALALVE